MYVFPILWYRGSTCLVDWKTSSKPRPLISDLYDYPLQAVAYAGAVNEDPQYPFKVSVTIACVTISLWYTCVLSDLVMLSVCLSFCLSIHSSVCLSVLGA